ncbi:MAG: asparagine synthase (glutamine-hydrolyzing) [Myxococcota bacterium]
MCGIAGYWTPKEEPREKLLTGMLDVINHRGPDGRGHHLDPDRGLAMGHARLSIIDLEGGQQPLHDPRNGRVLTVNGEFYDYKKIRAQLACDGERFTTKSDSEIALHLYHRHGLDFLTHLRGEFAFALFDPGQERLLLVRDRFGIKPLYLRFTEDEVFYGSEVKSVLMHPAVPRRVDRPMALHQMMQVMVPGRTSFEGIEAIEPGYLHVIERRGDRFAMERIRYWDLDFPRAEDHDSDPDEAAYVSGVRDRLLDAVATRLEADVPVGCYLSGGIDSCSILGLATPLQQSSVRAYTISFDSDAYDESAIAKEMAEATGAEQVVLSLSGDELYGDYFGKVVWHAERTFYNTLAVAKWHMSRRVHEQGRKVVITGEGSDELFGGYPFFKRDMFIHGLGLDPAEMERRNAVFKGAILSEEERHHPAWEALCGFTPSWIQPWLLTLERVRPLLSASVRAELEGYDPGSAIAARIDPGQVVGRHPLDMVQYTWSKTMLEGQILTWGGDRVDMANSMESRPAFLDHHLAEFAVQIPPELRIKDGTEKYVLREAMKGILPRVLYEREKFAFMAPPSSTDPEKAARVRALAEAWLNPGRIEEAGLFSVDAVQAFLDEAWAEDDAHAAGANKDIILNHLLGLQMLDALRQNPSRVPRADGS